VGICLERGPELVVAILAAVKAGGAYVPLDPGYPGDRLAFMLADAGVSVLVTQERLRATFPSTDLPVVSIDADAEEIASAGADDVDRGAGPRSLAYVIYTSGSTGTPKGVGVEHRSVVRLVRGANYARLEADEVILQAAPVSFDASTLELWGALLNGGRLVILPGSNPSLEELGRTLVRHGVTTLWLTAGLFQVMVEERLEDLAGVRQLLTGGDVLPIEQVRKVRERFPALRLINGYGPTENTTFTCCHTVGERWNGGPVPIGTPISNTRVYVLDAALRPAPVGVPGELFAGGDGVARGYLGHPALTAEKFVPDPFSAHPGERMYRTGDRVRWKVVGVANSAREERTDDVDAVIEYLGRLDGQVKVRGFRIEVGEVEAALRRHPAVTDCVVVAREDEPGEKRLAAYVVGEVDAAALRAHLEPILPGYMVPAAFVALDAIPLSPNGKVNRKALPAPSFAASADGYAAPRTPVEEVVAAVWAEVLRLERVGVHDDFFERGGHSLLATRMVSRLRQAFGVETPLRAVFEGRTVAALAERVEALRRDGAPQLPPIVPAPRTGPVPLSFAQERLWFLQRLEGGSFYNVPSALRLTGALDVPALERALGEVMRRHQALRTTFRETAGVAEQVIAPFAGYSIPVHDLTPLDGEAREAEVLRRVRDDAAEPFDLATGPLLRAALLRLAAGEHVLLLNLHHVVSDGWSMGVLFRELAALYGAYREGRPSPLPELAVQYADYAVWQRELLRGPVLERQLAWWTARLAGAPALLELPVDHPRPAMQSYRGTAERVELPRALLHRLEALGRGEGATLYMVLLAAFQLLLSRYGGSEDVVVGSPIAGRTRGETEGLIGFFVNTLVLRTDLSGDPGFRALLRRVRETTLGAYEHQELPFERLVEALQPERTLSHSPLFQAMFTLNDVDAFGGGLPGVQTREIDREATRVKYELTLGLETNERGLCGMLEYGTDLFERGTIVRMIGHLARLLEQVAENPEVRRSAIRLLGGEERRQLLEEWGATEGDAPGGLLLHELFALQAARTPGAEALRFAGRAITYRALDEAANRLAHHLAARGVGPETVVGLFAERAPQTVAAILAILKAGGAYLPLDPAHPEGRLRGVLADAGVRVVVAPTGLPPGLPAGLAADLVDLPAETAAIAARPAEAPAVRVEADGLAYVIFTSGSTGRPKGVLVTHRGVPNVIRQLIARFGLEGGGGRVLQFASFAFDAAVPEVFTALLSGGTLVLGTREELHAGPALATTLRRERIRVAILPPAVLAVLEPGELPALRTVVSAGEAVGPATVERWGAGRTFINAYGPTETTVGPACTPCRADGRTPPIGRPFANVRAYVLDAGGEPSPVGVPGELHVGGVGVARGYLGRPGQTAERFVPDPFSGHPGARLYRTGDRLRWRGPEGALEFVGRVDEQVKLRGFRIEPGEVERALCAHPGVVEARVVLHHDAAGEKRLVAYVVGGAPADALRAHLRRSMPEYMVPSAFVALDALPLTAVGKLDRRALPAPEYAAPAEDFVPPHTPAQQVLAEIWAEVLPVARVGVNDDFFDLGGHSLLIMRLLAGVHEAFGVELSIRAVFAEPTLGAMAAQVERLVYAEVAAMPEAQAERQLDPQPAAGG
jgi:amino acid adenylation domain-containing protein